jgi:hypothetical protein
MFYFACIISLPSCRLGILFLCHCGFVFEFYNSKSREILEFGQKENLFYMK